MEISHTSSPTHPFTIPNASFVTQINGKEYLVEVIVCGVSPDVHQRLMGNEEVFAALKAEVHKAQLAAKEHFSSLDARYGDSKTLFSTLKKEEIRTFNLIQNGVIHIPDQNGIRESDFALIAAEEEEDGVADELLGPLNRISGIYKYIVSQSHITTHDSSDVGSDRREEGVYEGDRDSVSTGHRDSTTGGDQREGEGVPTSVVSGSEVVRDSVSTGGRDRESTDGRNSTDMSRHPLLGEVVPPHVVRESEDDRGRGVSTSLRARPLSRGNPVSEVSPSTPDTLSLLGIKSIEEAINYLARLRKFPIIRGSELQKAFPTRLEDLYQATKELLEPDTLTKAGYLKQITRYDVSAVDAIAEICGEPREVVAKEMRKHINDLGGETYWIQEEGKKTRNFASEIERILFTP